ncbi:MAG TPA: PASTA domain-containing protein [Acidimicrobiales bacterium]|nr:PASTA domain-containing protein [Acidimicrobiales bacterium]
MTVPRVDDLLGRSLGDRYRVRGWLGAGASASVYLAVDERLDRQVALKVLHPALASDAGFLKRFQSEARAAARLRHPHIVQVYDWGEDPAGVYVVLEYLSGGSLRQMLDSSGPLSLAQVTAVGAQAAEGLAHAHQRGTAHRDIKPANLLFDDDGRLAIADFGIARAMADATWTEPAGVILGTARYASPEQAGGLVTGPATDVYSLSLVLVEAATGAVPFSADTTVATLMARQGRRVEAAPELGELGPLLTQTTDPEPAARPDAGWMAARLADVSRTLPRPGALPLAPPDVPADSGARTGPARDTTDVGMAAPVGAGRDATTLMGATAPSPAWAGEDNPWPVSSRVEVTTPVGSGGAGPGRRGGWRAALIVFLALLLAAIGGGVYWLFGVYQITVPRRVVPDVEGQVLARAEQALTAAHLAYRVDPPAYSATVPAGDVLTQSPRGGKLKQGSAVDLVASEGPAPRAVPGLSGLSQEAAGAALSRAGLGVKYAKAYSETVAAGTVLSWSPNSGLQPKGTVVTVTVSEGPQPRTVPALTGDTYAQAAAALTGLQLNPVESDVYNNQYPAGQVVGTTPAAGQSAARGSTVTVDVSKGPQQVQVPDVTGMNVADATSAIEAVGLVVNNVYGPPNHRVFVTDPTAGTTVDTGTGVTLYTN